MSSKDRVTVKAHADRLQAQTCIGSQARANDEDMQLCALHRDMWAANSLLEPWSLMTWTHPAMDHPISPHWEILMLQYD